ISNPQLPDLAFLRRNFLRRSDGQFSRSPASAKASSPASAAICINTTTTATANNQLCENSTEIGRVGFKKTVTGGGSQRQPATRRQHTSLSSLFSRQSAFFPSAGLGPTSDGFEPCSARQNGIAIGWPYPLASSRLQTAGRNAGGQEVEPPGLREQRLPHILFDLQTFAGGSPVVALKERLDAQAAAEARASAFAEVEAVLAAAKQAAVGNQQQRQQQQHRMPTLTSAGQPDNLSARKENGSKDRCKSPLAHSDQPSSSFQLSSLGRNDGSSVFEAGKPDSGPQISSVSSDGKCPWYIAQL
ncbi:unnamed protein product, partial [Protopolystoma xenopodis]